MLKRFCDFCNEEIKMIDDDRTTKTQWFEIHDGLHQVKSDICNKCLTEIVKVVKRENHGFWIKPDNMNNAECSICGAKGHASYYYCPMCGARLEI